MLASNHKQSPLPYSVPVQLDSRQTQSVSGIVVHETNFVGGYCDCDD